MEKEQVEGKLTREEMLLKICDKLEEMTAMLNKHNAEMERKLKEK